MAKYVCDFETVTSQGKELVKLASDIETSIKNYDKTVESDLSGWKSENAKAAFVESCKAQIQIADAYAKSAKELGEYIEKVSAEIEKLETELASADI